MTNGRVQAVDAEFGQQGVSGDTCVSSNTIVTNDITSPTTHSQCNSEQTKSESLGSSTSEMVDKGMSCDIQIHDSSVNTDDTYTSCQSLLTTIAEQEEKIKSLTSRLSLHSSPAAAMKNDNEQTLFLTGMPSNKMFKGLLNILLPVVKTKFTLPPADQLLLVLMKLWLAVPFQDLAYRFCVCLTTVSTIFHSVIYVQGVAATDCLV